MPIFKRQASEDKPNESFYQRSRCHGSAGFNRSTKSSYDWFLKFGIKELFDEVSPMTDFTGRDLELYLDDYYLDEPKFDEVVCRERNLTFEALRCALPPDF